MLKRLSLAILAVVFGLTLAACDGEEVRSDSDILLDLKNAITFEETELTDDLTLPTIDEEGVTATWTSSNPSVLAIDGTVTRPAYYQADREVSLSLALELNGIIVTKVFQFVVLKEDAPETIELNTDYTDALPLDFAYENSDFIADGVGEVTLVQCVDGDTAHFTEGDGTFSVRFLGINTPESTAKFEPWGKAASEFTCDKLENATTIVLQADPAAGRLDSYGERWLAWVWYDGRLLNLELLEQAYTKPSGAIDTYYGQLLYDVSLEVKFSDRRVWGEVDPDFDYSLEGIQLTIEELVTNPSEYIGLKVAITGVVSRRVGGAAFVQQGDYGIYVYNRAWAPDLNVGNEVLLSGLTVTYYPDVETGALQVSGYQTRDPYSQVLSTGNTVEATTITIPDITLLHIGRLLRLEHLEVISVYQSTDAFTVTVEDAAGNRITLRKAEGASSDITVDLFQVGSTVTVVGPLSRYMSTYQLMLSSVDDITVEE
jgi:micrococcal nuclease